MAARMSSAVSIIDGSRPHGHRLRRGYGKLVCTWKAPANGNHIGIIAYFPEELSGFYELSAGRSCAEGEISADGRVFTDRKS
jgi:hypothetical protein